MVVAFAAMVRNGAMMLLGSPDPSSPAISVPRSVAGALVTGVILSLALGLTAGPFTQLFHSAAISLGAPR